MSDQQKTPASVEVDAARLKAGGDIRAAYSGEIIMTTPHGGVAEIPPPFSEGDVLYTTTSIVVGVGGTAYALTPIAGPDDGAPEGRPRDSYEHRVVKHGEQHYRLTAPPLRLMARSEEPAAAPQPQPQAGARPATPAHAQPPQPEPVAAAIEDAADAEPTPEPSRAEATPPAGESAEAAAASASEASPPTEAAAAQTASEHPTPDADEEAESFPEADAAAAGSEHHDAAETDAQQQAAAPPAKEEPAPPPRPRTYEWDQAPVCLIVTLRRDDGNPDGRPVLIAVQNHDDTPLFSTGRLKLDELPAPLAAALERLRVDMPNRAAAYEARLEAKREEEERRKEKELAQKIKSGARAKKSASRPNATRPQPVTTAGASATDNEPDEDAEDSEQLDDVSVVSDDSAPNETVTAAPTQPPAKPTPARAQPAQPSAQASLFG